MEQSLWDSGGRFFLFTANIRNRSTRRAYNKAASRFLEWCHEGGLDELAQVKPLHIFAYIESLLQEFAIPSVRQHLVAVRMLFDWLIVSQVVDTNPARAVREPKQVAKKERTPVLDRAAGLALFGRGMLMVTFATERPQCLCRFRADVAKTTLSETRPTGAT